MMIIITNQTLTKRLQAAEDMARMRSDERKEQQKQTWQNDSSKKQQRSDEC